MSEERVHLALPYVRGERIYAEAHSVLEREERRAEAQVHVLEEPAHRVRGHHPNVPRGVLQVIAGDVRAGVSRRARDVMLLEGSSGWGWGRRVCVEGVGGGLGAQQDGKEDEES